MNFLFTLSQSLWYLSKMWWRGFDILYSTYDLNVIILQVFQLPNIFLLDASGLLEIFFLCNRQFSNEFCMKLMKGGQTTFAGVVPWALCSVWRMYKPVVVFLPLLWIEVVGLTPARFSCEVTNVSTVTEWLIWYFCFLRPRRVQCILDRLLHTQNM